MDTWDNARPDRDEPIGASSAISEGGSAGAGRGAGTEAGPHAGRETGPQAELEAGPHAGLEAGPRTEPDLRRALNLIADHYSSAPQGDLFPQVMARATRIRRRRRAMRAGAATAVLVVAAVLGPSVASQLGMHGGAASAAPPPSAIVDLTSAYPVPAAAQGDDAVATPTQPANALTWPSRGAAVPAQAVDVAKSYLLDHVEHASAAVPTAPATPTTPTTTATVTTLWAQVDEDTTVATPTAASTAAPTAAPTGHGVPSKAPPKAVSQKAHKTWLYVMQGWTNGPDGTPSSAQLLVGDYTQTETQAGKASSMSVYATPVTFTHARPGSSDDADDTQQIAELSVWLPQSNRLVVLGTPQTETVLYAKTGGDLIPEKTDDGVAVFPRTRQLVKGRYADAIQVRDAKNVALTPPRAWSAADFALDGAMSLWSSGSGEWGTVPARAGGGGAGAARPSPDSTTGPGVGVSGAGSGSVSGSAGSGPAGSASGSASGARPKPTVVSTPSGGSASTGPSSAVP